MGRLHLVIDTPIPDAALVMMHSDWARFLPDPTMLDVSLYFSRRVYAARLQHHAMQFLVDVYKGRAIRSVRKRLSDGPPDLNDSLIASILILSVLDVCPHSGLLSAANLGSC